MQGKLSQQIRKDIARHTRQIIMAHHSQPNFVPKTNLIIFDFKWFREVIKNI